MTHIKRLYDTYNFLTCGMYENQPYKKNSMKGMDIQYLFIIFAKRFATNLYSST